VSKLRILDLALLVVAGLLGWQGRREWIESHARELVLLHGGLPPAKVRGLSPLDKVDPLTAAAYLEVATKNLFSQDRNPSPIIDPLPPPPEKPTPPFPVAHGVMLWDGAPPTIVLSEKSNGPQKGYHPGESIGQWKLVSLDSSFVDLEWDGKEFKKRIDELIDLTPIVEVSQPAASKAAPAAAPAVKALSTSTGRAGPGAIETGPGQKSCNSDDTSPDGTIVDGMRKIVTATPFGSSCRWEQTK
jgi:hypothetical protein